MPDDTKLMQIDRAINRQVAGGMALGQQGVGAVMMPRTMGEVMEFAKLMSVSGVCIRPVFRGNPGACLAITMQAMKWGADPFAVANKAYVTKSKSGDEQIAYEAQLVHAIVNTSPVLKKRLRPTYEGQGAERKCRIVGHVHGEDDPLEYESPPIRSIGVKNSPLWTSDPDQQLFYYSTRAWARRHVPEILLGIYTPEEFAGETIELTPEPEPSREEFAQVEYRQEPERRFEVVDLDGEVIGYADQHRAAQALRIVLTDAARQGVDRLDAAWENNEALIGEIDPKTRDELAGEYADLREKVVETSKRDAAATPRNETPERGETVDPERKSGDADVDGMDEASAGTSDGSKEEVEPRRTAPAEAQQRGPVAEPTGKPAETHREAGGSPVPAAQPSSQLPASAALGGAAERPEPSDVASSPSEARGDAPPDDDGWRQSLGEPAGDVKPYLTPNALREESGNRKSLYIAPPLKRGTDKPDYRAWAVALFLPKVRRCKTNEELAYLLGDNDASVSACRSGGLAFADLSEFDKTITAQWSRVQ